MSKQEEEESLLLTRFRGMADKDRAWILAMSDRCFSERTKGPEELVIAIRHSPPGE